MKAIPVSIFFIAFFAATTIFLPRFFGIQSGRLLSTGDIISLQATVLQSELDQKNQKAEYDKKVSNDENTDKRKDIETKKPDKKDNGKKSKSSGGGVPPVAPGGSSLDIAVNDTTGG